VKQSEPATARGDGTRSGHFGGRIGTSLPLEDRSKGLGAGIGEMHERELEAATRRRPSRKRCHATPSNDDQRGGAARPRWREDFEG